MLRHLLILSSSYYFVFFNDTATTEIYTLSLHDALPICGERTGGDAGGRQFEHGGQRRDHLLALLAFFFIAGNEVDAEVVRSEEHTSELQSHSDLVCRLLLEKKKK